MLDTLEVVAATPATRRVLVLDGAPGSWVPAGLDIVPQAQGGLAHRLDAAFAAAFAAGEGPVVLVGMDTPQVTSADLLAAGRMLTDSSTDAVVGAALDGGFWLLGLAESLDDLCRGVPMSATETCARQVARLEAAGRQVRMTRSLRDIDHLDDAVAVASEIPASRLAGVVSDQVSRLS